jgi:hypothetical protein
MEELAEQPAVLRIALYTTTDTTGSIRIMCEDLQREFTALGHTCLVVSSTQECLDLDPYLIMCFRIESMLSIQHMSGRWYGCEKLINVFPMACYAYTMPMLAGYLATADITTMVAISHSSRRELWARAREIFNAGLLRKIQQNLITIPYGVLDIYQFKKKHGAELDRWVAPLTRLVADKWWPLHPQINRETLALFRMHKFEPTTDLYYARESDSKVDVKNTDGYNTPKPIIKDRAEYAQAMSQYAFAFCVCSFESFGLYYLELLLSGCIVVFVDYPWVHELLPGYKYVVQADEVSGLMLHLRQHYDEAFEYIEHEVVPYIRQHYLLSGFAQRVLELLPSLPKGINRQRKDSL